MFCAKVIALIDLFKSTEENKHYRESYFLYWANTPPMVFCSFEGCCFYFWHMFFQKSLGTNAWIASYFLLFEAQWWTWHLFRNEPAFILVEMGCCRLWPIGNDWKSTTSTPTFSYPNALLQSRKSVSCLEGFLGSPVGLCKIYWSYKCWKSKLL